MAPNRLGRCTLAGRMSIRAISGRMYWLLRRSLMTGDSRSHAAVMSPPTTIVSGLRPCARLAIPSPRYSAVAVSAAMAFSSPRLAWPIMSVIDVVIEHIFETALLQEGLHPDPASMANRMYQLMQAATQPSDQDS